MKKLLSLAAAIIITAAAFAQVDEVTLTTIGTGRTEEEATLRALRNALEQTFGTFVSANTSIVNDALVRDEIAATSKGNVKEYHKLSVIELPNKTTSVTLKATISINKLISYARNNGSRAEFAGQTYAMNVKLLKLQQENASKTLDVMKDNVVALCHGIFDYDIKLGDIRKEKLFRFENINDNNYSIVSEYILPITLDVYSTDVTTNIYSLVTETFNAISMSPSMVKDFDRNDLVHCGDLPISRTELNVIGKLIQKAIVSDFFNVKLRKIGDSEIYAFKAIDKTKAVIYYDAYLEHGSPYINKSYLWLVSNRQTPKAIITYRNSDTPRNGINHNGSNPNIFHILFPCAGINRFSELTKWNTDVDGQIYQQKLHSFNLCIVLTDEELERFNGLELVGVTSPKHTSVPKPDKKKAAVKGLKKMNDLPTNSPISIQSIRIITSDLPKKAYTISFTRKDPKTGLQTYKITVSSKKQECKYWEYNGDPFMSAFAITQEKKERDGYIEFELYGDECKITKFPEELSNFVYVQLKK